MDTGGTTPTREGSPNDGGTLGSSKPLDGWAGLGAPAGGACGCAVGDVAAGAVALGVDAVEPPVG